MKTTKKIKANKIKPFRPTMNQGELLTYIGTLRYEIKYLRLQAKDKEELIQGIIMLLVKERGK